MIFEGKKKSIFFGLGLTRAGKSLPTVDNLYALSKLFGVTIENILVGNDEFVFYHIGKLFELPYMIKFT